MRSGRCLRLPSRARCGTPPLDALPFGDGARRTRPVTDPARRRAALRAFVEQVIPDRSGEVRGGDRKELAATAVPALRVPAG
jgi:hypothetical protein